MKKILFITMFSFFLSFNISIAAEKKCANFKIFTPEHNKCVKEKTKSFTKKTKEFGKKGLKKLNTDSKLTDWLKKKSK